MPPIDQGVRHQLHAVVTLLPELKAKQQPLEFILPCKSPLYAQTQRMDGSIEQPLPPTLPGLLLARAGEPSSDHLANTLWIVSWITAVPSPARGRATTGSD
jgi:hypothetical protein